MPIHTHQWPYNSLQTWKTKFGVQILCIILQASPIHSCYRTLQLATTMGIPAQSSQTSQGYYTEMCPTLECKAYTHTQTWRIAMYVYSNNNNGFQILNISQYYIQTPHLNIHYIFIAEWVGLVTNSWQCLQCCMEGSAWHETHYHV